MARERTRRRWPWAVLVATLIAAGAGSAWWLTSRDGDGIPSLDIRGAAATEIADQIVAARFPQFATSRRAVTLPSEDAPYRMLVEYSLAEDTAAGRPYARVLLVYVDLESRTYRVVESL